MEERKTIGQNFEQDVKLNRFHLDEEAQMQPELHYLWSKRLAEKKSFWNKIRAKAELLIREQPEKYLPIGAKLTESAVEAVLKSDEEISKMNEEVLLLEAAVSSLEDRRSEIKNLTELYIAGYFALPEGGRPTQERVAATELRRKMRDRKEV